MRALVVSNMLPDSSHPERGRFVRDQVAALRSLQSLESPQLESPQLEPPQVESPQLESPQLEPPQVEPPQLESPQLEPLQVEPLQVELFEFAPGARSMASAARELRSRYGSERLDVVHAHFGLSAYPALAVKARAHGVTLHGTDVSHPRTRLLTRAILPRMELVGAASQALLERIPGARAQARARVLPCGVDMRRFHPIARSRAREALGLDAARPLLLLAADPARPEKRHDRAQALARAVGAELLTLGGISPERVPLYVNAANAVVIPSEREGFGLAALEALACDVAVLATPVGIHEQALLGIAGCLCAPFDVERWAAALLAHVSDGETRIAGRASAERYSCERMAKLLAQAWSSLLATAG